MRRIQTIAESVESGELSALTDGEKKRVRQAFAAREEQLLATLDGVEVHGRDAVRLAGSGWLNDEVINAYLIVLQRRADADPKTCVAALARPPAPVVVNTGGAAQLFQVPHFQHVLLRAADEEGQRVRLRASARVCVADRRRTRAATTTTASRAGRAPSTSLRSNACAAAPLRCRALTSRRRPQLFVPVHLGTHWCLAVVNVAQQRFEYYDSLGHPNPACLTALRR